ncbi:MAG TPA: hypothetical protein VNT77_06020 [Allosphingosinicella sp.]|nr:hypothetical protein [Allosphingosinicella sp.]
MPRRSIILTCLAALALSACAATPYRPVGQRSHGGYSEISLGQGRFLVRFEGNARTPQDRVERYMLRRAAELTLAHGYDWFRTVNRQMGTVIGQGKTPDGRSYRVVQGPGYQRWRDYGDYFAKSGFGLWRPIWRSFTGSTGERLEASAEIVMGRGPAPVVSGQAAALDARQLLREMGG